MSNLLECIQDCQHIMACYPSMHQTYKNYSEQLGVIMTDKKYQSLTPSDELLTIESMFEYRQNIRKRINDVRLFTHNYHYVQDKNGRFTMSNIFDQNECVPHYVFDFATTRFVKVSDYRRVLPLAEYLKFLENYEQEYEEMTKIIMNAREEFNRTNPDII